MDKFLQEIIALRVSENHFISKNEINKTDLFILLAIKTINLHKFGFAEVSDLIELSAGLNRSAVYSSIKSLLRNDLIQTSRIGKKLVKGATTNYWVTTKGNNIIKDYLQCAKETEKSIHRTIQNVYFPIPK